MAQGVARRSTRGLVVGVLALLILLLMTPTQALARKHSGNFYSVSVSKGYLALRTAPAYDERNEIGELYTGDVVERVGRKTRGDYWKVWSPKYRKSGWVNKNYLRSYETSVGESYRVKVAKGYLALRTKPSYNESNEIGELYTGDVVTLIERYNSKYWWVYSPKYGRYGYVNCNYLTDTYRDSYADYTVRVAKGYLALRTKPAYNDRNEIGELYTGDVVTLIECYNDTYWWVYSPKYGRYGYVNRNYLADSYYDSYGDYTVRVSKGYLALRTAPAYDDRNEIGELYTGDVVAVEDKSNGAYWWVYSYRLGKSGYVNKDYLR